MESEFRHVTESIRRDVESSLQTIGIYCRVFGRGKSQLSLDEKLQKEPGKYQQGKKLIQDAIGIRVALYFAEDIEIVASVLSGKYQLDADSSTIDIPDTDQFAVQRHNLIYRVPEGYVELMQRAIGAKPVDTTFEVQLRTVLSEGWHEVDHDLRYKCRNDWENNDDLSRALNGIMATLETAEWSMQQIFSELSYRHYKKKNWSSMLLNALKIRTNSKLSDELIDFFNDHEDIAKEALRINRKAVVNTFGSLKLSLPVNLNNIIYIWKYQHLKNPMLTALTPSLIIESLEKQK